MLILPDTPPDLTIPAVLRPLRNVFLSVFSSANARFLFRASGSHTYYEHDLSLSRI